MKRGNFFLVIFLICFCTQLYPNATPITWHGKNYSQNEMKRLFRNAATLGDVEGVKQILILFPEALDSQGADGSTALHRAVRANRFDVVQHLVSDWGADLTIKDNSGNIPADLARNRAVKKLLQPRRGLSRHIIPEYFSLPFEREKSEIQEKKVPAKRLQQKLVGFQDPKTLESFLQKIGFKDVRFFKVFFDSFKKLPLTPDDFIKIKFFTRDLLLVTAQEFIRVRKEVLSTGTWLKGGTKDYCFVQKLILPENSEVELRGDLHGDVHSLLNWMDELINKGWLDKNNPFKITKDNAYVAFLGDYADRGRYGAEIMFIIMLLYLHNPDQVIIVRGNHEDRDMIAQFGFGLELVKKLGFNKKQFESFVKVYDYLPVAVFLGCKNNGSVDFIQLCHGGMEPGYNYAPLLDGNEGNNVYEWINEKLDKNGSYRYQEALNLTKDTTIKQGLEELKWQPLGLGGNNFQWTDFDFFNKYPDKVVDAIDGRGFTVYQNYATDILQNATKKNKLWAVLRAHQHGGDTVPAIVKQGKGIYKLWPNEKKQWSGKLSDPMKLEKFSVWTFNVAPRTGVYELAEKTFNFDTVAHLTLKNGFDNWVFQPRQIPVKKTS